MVEGISKRLHLTARHFKHSVADLVLDTGMDDDDLSSNPIGDSQLKMLLNSAKVERLRGRSKQISSDSGFDASIDLDRKTEDLLRRCDALLGRTPSAQETPGQVDFFVSPATSLDFDDESLPPSYFDVEPKRRDAQSQISTFARDAASQTPSMITRDAVLQTLPPAVRDTGIDPDPPEEESDDLLRRAATFHDDSIVAAFVARIRDIQCRLRAISTEAD